MTLAHLHMQSCRCTRCGVARNYARLLAARALEDEAEAAQPVAVQEPIAFAEPDGADLDVVAHSEMMAR